VTDASHRRWLIPLFLLAFLAVRLVILFYPQSSGWNVVDDELPTGNIAVDLDHELILPMPAYQFKPFAAGTMISGLLSAGFRSLLGPNLLALKASALLLQTLALLFWMLALWKLLGRVAAIAFGLLFTLAPPTWLNLSHMAWGNHAEQTFFVGLVFLLLVHLWLGRGAGNPPHPAGLFATGVVTGFSVYYSYSGVPLTLFLLLFVALLGGRGGRRRILPLTAGGIVVGLAPLAWSASFYGLRALGRIDTYTGYAEGELVDAGRLFFERNLLHLPGKLLHFLFIDLPNASLYPAAWARWLFFLLVLAALTSALIFGRKTLGQMLRGIGKGGLNRDGVRVLLVLTPLMYGVIYAAVFVFSGFRVLTPEQPLPSYYGHYRYLAPMFPVAFALVGWGLQSLWEAMDARPTRQLGLLAVLTLVLLAISLPYYRSVSKGMFSRDVLDVRGDYYLPVVERLAIEVSQNEWTRAEQLSAVERLPKKYHHLFFEQMGKVGPIGKTLGLQMIQKSYPNFEADLLRGYGRFTGGEIAEGDPATWPARVDEELESANLDESLWRHDFINGVGTELARIDKIPPIALVELFDFWRNERMNDYIAMHEGIGRFAGATLSIHLLEDPRLPAAFWRGYGRQVRQNAETMLLSRAPVAYTLLPEDSRKRGEIIAGFAEAGRLFEE